MTPRKAFFHAEVEKKGTLPLAHYIELCLNHPQFGYYQNEDIFGTKGDFITAPEISQIFGELIGLWLVQCWHDQKKPAPFTLLELGPGRGTMMADIWRATANFPDFQESAHVILVENSPHLQTLQQKRLHALTPKWQSAVQKLPEQPLFFIANEFFDALAIEHFRRTKKGWESQHVALQNDALVPCYLPCPAPHFAKERTNELMQGDIIEHCPQAGDIMSALGRTIAQFGGGGLVIDYGDWQSLGDTFQALFRHKPCSPFDRPGECDLSAHVDFKTLSRASPALKFTRLTPQGVFLNRLGARERTEILGKNLAGKALEAHIEAYRRLTSPDEMGTLFKAMAFYPPKSPLPAGFVE